ncbi:MAG: hypothetical protein KIT27_12440 [Legionellales bacterium]|nr:hypothetical protein [Legionellales bacterium]
MIQFSVYRYHPEKDKSPHMQNYELDPANCNGVMLLNALEALKIQDPTLTFRRSCGEGVCGSDGMNMGRLAQPLENTHPQSCIIDLLRMGLYLLAFSAKFRH